MVSRRDLIKTLGATGGAGAFTSGAATAALTRDTTAPTPAQKEKAREAQERYDSVSAANIAIEEHGKDLLAELLEQNIITTPSFSQFQSDHISQDGNRGSSALRVSSFSIDGTYTARIATGHRTLSQEIKMFIHPQADSHYAIVESLDDNSSVLIVEDTSSRVVGIRGCNRAPNDICRYDYTKECCPSRCYADKYERYQCYPSGACYAGSHIGCCRDEDKC